MFDRDEAESFFKELENRFKYKEDKLTAFLNTIKVCSKRRGYARYSRRMEKILEDDKDMIPRLNKLMPDRYKIYTSPKKRPHMGDANYFLSKIRARFQGVDDHIYKSLIRILNRFRRKVKSFDEVCEEVTTLLKDHPGLVYEFTLFLPEKQKTMRRDIKEISNSNSTVPNSCLPIPDNYKQVDKSTTS